MRKKSLLLFLIAIFPTLQNDSKTIKDYKFIAEFTNKDNNLKKSLINIETTESNSLNQEGITQTSKTIDFEIKIFNELNFPSDGFFLKFSVKEENLKNKEEGKIIQIDELKVEELYYFSRYDSVTESRSKDLKISILMFLDKELKMEKISEKLELELSTNLSNSQEEEENIKKLESISMKLTSLSDIKIISISSLGFIILLNIALTMLTFKFLVKKFDFKNLKNKHIPLYGILASWVTLSSTARLFFQLPRIFNFFFLIACLMMICVFRKHTSMQILYFENGINEIIFFLFSLFFGFSFIWTKFIPFLIFLIFGSLLVDQILTEERKMISSYLLISSLFFSNFYYVFFFPWNFWGHPVDSERGVYYTLGYLLSILGVVLNEKLILDENWDGDIRENIKIAYFEIITNRVAKHLKNTFIKENIFRRANENNLIVERKVTKDMREKAEDDWNFDEEVEVKKKDNGVIVVQEKGWRSKIKRRRSSVGKKKWTYLAKNVEKLKALQDLKETKPQPIKENADEWDFGS